MENFRDIEDDEMGAWGYPAVTWVGDQALLTYVGGLSPVLKILPKGWFTG